jgi:hypothetical protein
MLFASILLLSLSAAISTSPVTDTLGDTLKSPALESQGHESGHATTDLQPHHPNAVFLNPSDASTSQPAQRPSRQRRQKLYGDEEFNFPIPNIRHDLLPPSSLIGLTRTERYDPERTFARHGLEVHEGPSPQRRRTLGGFEQDLKHDVDLNGPSFLGASHNHHGHDLLFDSAGPGTVGRQAWAENGPISDTPMSEHGQDESFPSLPRPGSLSPVPNRGNRRQTVRDPADWEKVHGPDSFSSFRNLNTIPE